MPTPPLSDEVLQEMVDAYRAHGYKKKAASRALGMDNETFRNRLRIAAERGFIAPEETLPGYVYTSISTKLDSEGNVLGYTTHQKQERTEAGPLPEGHRLKGVSRYIDGQGRLIGQWEKTVSDGPDPVDIAQKIAEAFDGKKFELPRISTPQKLESELLTLYPLADWHLGMMAWGKETSENWDLKIAMAAMRSTMASIFSATPASKTGVILGCGDFLHSDNKRNETAQHGNPLDVDGRYQKVLEAACGLAADLVLMAIQKHEHVHVRFLPGNHDEYSAIAITSFLRGVFAQNDRVTVDNDPSDHWVHSFGKCLLVATHGHKIKPGKLQDFVTSAFRKEWGEAEHVHGFVGHFHHREKIANENGGMLIELLPAPIPPDAFHWGAGYMSGRALLGITYHSEYGEISRDTRTLRAA